MQAHDTESLSEQIAKHISEQIIRGELVEGERIQELRIAAELDVSRGSVREALLLLERTHLIEIYPRRGAIVSEKSAQQVRALFHFLPDWRTWIFSPVYTDSIHPVRFP